MGFLDSLFGSGEPYAEIKEKVENSECTGAFVSHFTAIFNPGGEEYQWLTQNSKERMFKIDFFKNGVQLTWIEVNRARLKQTGTYDVDVTGVGFGASAYADLPNSNYIYCFRSIILKAIEKDCPNIKMIDGDHLMLKESSLQGW